MLKRLSSPFLRILLVTANHVLKGTSPMGMSGARVIYAWPVMLGLMMGVTHQLAGFWTNGSVALFWKMRVSGDLIARGHGVIARGRCSHLRRCRILVSAFVIRGQNGFWYQCHRACETWLFGLVA